MTTSPAWRYRRLILELMRFLGLGYEQVLRLPDFMAAEAITLLNEARAAAAPPTERGAYDEYYDDGPADGDEPA